MKSEPLEDESGSNTLIVVSPSPPPVLDAQRSSAADDLRRESTKKPILGTTSTPLHSSASSPNFTRISPVSASSSSTIPTSGFITPRNGSPTSISLPHRLETVFSLASSDSTAAAGSTSSQSLLCGGSFFVAESSSSENPDSSPSPPFVAKVVYRSHVPSFPTETPRSPSPQPSTSRAVSSLTPLRSPSPELAGPLANLAAESPRSSAVRFSAEEVAKLTRTKLFSPIVPLQRYQPSCNRTAGEQNGENAAQTDLDGHVTIKLERSIDIDEDNFTDNKNITADYENATAKGENISAVNENATAKDENIIADNEVNTVENAENLAPNDQLLTIRSRVSTRSRRDHPLNLLRKQEQNKTGKSLSRWGNLVKKRKPGRPRVAKAQKQRNKN